MKNRAFRPIIMLVVLLISTSLFSVMAYAAEVNITMQPVDQNVQEGDKVSFRVEAESGDMGVGLAYQWYENDSAIDGANLFIYTINDVGMDRSGNEYKCGVSLEGSTDPSLTRYSNVARLTVSPRIQPTPAPASVACTEPAVVNVDLDTFKSEAPVRTCYSTAEDRFADMKIHSVVDNKTLMNQKFLMAELIGPDAREKLTFSIYAPYLGAGVNNGEKRTLIWEDYTGSGVEGQRVDAVVYNQIDGAYVINGIYKDNSTIEFSDFIYRDASTITIAVK